MVLAFIINSLVVAVTVSIHYEMLRFLSKFIPRLKLRNRLKVVIGVYGTICAHIVEIWIFGIAFFFMVHNGGFGSLGGNFNGSLLDCVYFSFTNYTTVGYGDIEPFGMLRFLSGLEGITGLSLITWSASFMYMEMTRFWE